MAYRPRSGVDGRIVAPLNLGPCHGQGHVLGGGDGVLVGHRFRLPACRGGGHGLDRAAGEVGGGVVEVVRLVVCPLAQFGVYVGLQFIPVLQPVAGDVEVAHAGPLAGEGDRVLPGQQQADRDPYLGPVAGDDQMTAVDVGVVVLLRGHDDGGEADLAALNLYGVTELEAGEMGVGVFGSGELGGGGGHLGLAADFAYAFTIHLVMWARQLV